MKRALLLTRNDFKVIGTGVSPFHCFEALVFLEIHDSAKSPRCQLPAPAPKCLLVHINF